jgi:hypothetical protein
MLTYHSCHTANITVTKKRSTITKTRVEPKGVISSLFVPFRYLTKKKKYSTPEEYHHTTSPRFMLKLEFN